MQGADHREANDKEDTSKRWEIEHVYFSTGDLHGFGILGLVNLQNKVQDYLITNTISVIRIPNFITQKHILIHTKSCQVLEIHLIHVSADIGRVLVKQF